MGICDCFKRGTSDQKPGPQPSPSPPPVRTKTQHLAWYDVTSDREYWCCMDAAARSSNMFYMRIRNKEYEQLIPRAHALGHKAAIVAGEGDSSGHIAETIAACQAIHAAGLEIVACMFWDEPDIKEEVRNGLNMTQYLNQAYDALKAGLTAVGLGHIPLGFPWALAGNWQERIDRFGIPKQDIFITDGWYTPRAGDCHLVVPRFLSWAGQMVAAQGQKDFIHVIKAWSKKHPNFDREHITPEWVVRQLKCVTGTGSSSWEWTNPNYGDTALIHHEPLPYEYTGDVLLFKMDPAPSEDSDRAGGNQPEIIEAVRAFAKPHGWTSV